MSPVRTPAAAGQAPPEGLATVADVLGRNIKAYRVLKGWMQQDLIERMARLGLDWTRQTVYYTEAGRRNVTATELVALALAFDVSVGELLNPQPAGVKVALRGTWEWLALDGDDLATVLLWDGAA